ncbi:outer membrane lipid asymmetry maintenance protein MlaD [Amaricoccus sp.]|uniref:outer membrane lipid asymmetry maintenance protein MlaD n=1 Tax=Amaricoccus sp. TaxID=1872485 RepID=UPI001B5EDE86|nr:outer membrane lipid asymmetry maintenance protein MlaD [Amaricoccus sp.]MBP7001094.1 outer membrane lipid asymmetry maintenance protein MlaD [Amaricoccus sp.]
MAQNSVAETVIGAAVIAAAIGFVVYAGQVSGRQATRDSYALSARFRSVEGVAVGTDVRLAGIRVGSVTGLALDPASYEATATFAVDRSVKLPEDSDVKVASEGLLGGSFIEITPGASEFMLDDGGEILNTQSSVSLLNLLMKFAGGGGGGQ